MDNTSKILWYLRLVSKGPITVDDKVHDMGINEIKLSPTFFYSDDCQVCGDCCCVAEDNVYTQHEYDLIMNMTEEEFRAEGYIFSEEGFDPSYLVRLKEKVQPEYHIVNGKEVPFYVAKREDVKLTRVHCAPEKADVEVPRCTWTRRDPDGLTKCSIHPVRSVTCDMPHVRFIYRKGGNLSIGIVQYGRNWAMGCPVTFHAPKDEEEWKSNKENRLRKLNHLLKCADDLGVETWLPEIINYVENIPYENYERWLGKTICGNNVKSTPERDSHRPSNHKQSRNLFDL